MLGGVRLGVGRCKVGCWEGVSLVVGTWAGWGFGEVRLGAERGKGGC